MNLIALRNLYKKNDKDPDFHILDGKQRVGAMYKCYNKSRIAYFRLYIGERNDPDSQRCCEDY